MMMLPNQKPHFPLFSDSLHKSIKFYKSDYQYVMIDCFFF